MSDVMLALAERYEQRAHIDPTLWRYIARPEQVPPDTDTWLTWIYKAGRGAGKTRSCAEWIVERARTPGLRIALVGRTPADVRDVMIEGESGLIACSPATRKPIYEPTKRRLTWPNGTTATAYSAEVPSQLRGPQHHHAWCDEISSWTDAYKGDTVDTAWNNLMLGLRIGQHPQVVVSTTPKPNKLTRQIIGRPSTIISHGTTYDNLANLAPTFRSSVLAAYEGTRIGRQELMGEILEDVEGALWTMNTIDDDRVDRAPDLDQVVVAVDPAVTSTSGSDHTGLIVLGTGATGVTRHGYVLASDQIRATPHAAMLHALRLGDTHDATTIVVEKNNGGDYLTSVLRGAMADSGITMRIVTVNATKGKLTRAEPVAALYEQHRMHHVGPHPRLEDQLTTYTGDGSSPDMLDALVWAAHHVMLRPGGGAAYLSVLRSKAIDQGITIQNLPVASGG
ncbi:MAG: DNA-packaging protein [Dermatophilaceae bacterium]